MNLKEIKTISELSQETGIKQNTLRVKAYELINDGALVEFKHYKKLGGNQPYIFNKKGVEIILGGKENGGI